MAFDFRARQVRVNQIINSGSAITSPLLVYGVGAATNNEGGTNASHFPGLGSDVWLYVSGTRGVADTAYGAVAFRGDVVVSGALQVGDRVVSPSTPGIGKGVIFARTGSLYFKNDSGTEYDLVASAAPAGAGNWNELSPSPRLNTTASVAIAGQLGTSYAAQSAGSDVFFFVSGTESNRVSLFGGRVVSSGSIRIKDTSGNVSFVATPAGIVSSSGDAQFGGTLEVASDANVFGVINVKDAVGAIKVNITPAGNISGSNQLQVGGDAVIADDLTAGGDVFFPSGSLRLGVASGVIKDFSNHSRLTFVDTGATVLGRADGTGALTILASGDATFAENLTVSGPNTTVNTLTSSLHNTTGLTASFISPPAGSPPVVIRATNGTGLIAPTDSILFVSGTKNSGLSAVFDCRLVTSGNIRVFSTLSNDEVASINALTGRVSSSQDVVAANFMIVNGGTISTSATTLNIAPANATTINLGIAASAINIASASSLVTFNDAIRSIGNANFDGNVVLGSNSSDDIHVSGSIVTNILPKADSVFNLGSPVKRWANVYTGDLHLRNDRGDWTVIEEENFLRIRNNQTGKNFKILMEPID